MPFKLNYRKLWEGLKAEAAMLPFRTNDPNERLIMEVTAKWLRDKMGQQEAAQRAEVEEAKRLFNIES